MQVSWQRTPLRCSLTQNECSVILQQGATVLYFCRAMQSGSRWRPWGLESIDAVGSNAQLRYCCQWDLGECPTTCYSCQNVFTWFWEITTLTLIPCSKCKIDYLNTIQTICRPQINLILWIPHGRKPFLAWYLSRRHSQQWDLAKTGKVKQHWRQDYAVEWRRKFESVIQTHVLGGSQVQHSNKTEVNEKENKEKR